MVTPLLKTKTHIPRARGELVHRPRLTEKFSRNIDSKLVLISAPAGFGKTTLISGWLQDVEWPVGWISLDHGDNDLVRFLAYIILALQGIEESFGTAIFEGLHSTQQPSMESILNDIINEAVENLDPFTLVLDDYHVITEKAVHETTTYFLEHLPPNARVVLLTRADPPWPIARLRAKGEMIEIRAKDLRFTKQEATKFLNEVMGLKLTAENVKTLEARTEGWIVGLQMAALSMQSNDDVEGLITELSGSHRFILDYLMEEVLVQQPAGIQEFLLRTSILERMNAPLCDVLISEIGDRRLQADMLEDSNLLSRCSHLHSSISSQQILEYLEKSNLFLIPLDDERGWYRYHHLFSDLLRSRLEQSSPNLIQDLFDVASRWCDKHSFIPEAVKYALSAESFDRAADLIEKHAVNTIEFGGSTTLLGWLKDLPEATLQDRPWIHVHNVWALMHAGQLDAAEAMAGRIMELLTENGISEVAQVQHLKSHLLAIHANIAEIRGDRLLAVQLSEEALELLPASDLRMKSILLMLRSFSLQWSGNFEEAAKSSEAAVALSKEIGNLRISVAALNDLAALRIYQGRLHEALAACEQSLEIVKESRESEQGLLLQSEGVTYYYMSRVFLEWNNLSAAMGAVSKGMELTKQGGGIDIGVVGSADLVRTLLALGELEKAQEIVLNLKNLYPELAAVRLPAIEAIVMIALGDLHTARRLIEGEGFSSEDEPDFTHLLMQRTLARVLVGEGKNEEALNFLNRLKVFSEEKGVTRNTIEILILQAIALQATGEEDRAIEALQEALVLSEPEGFVRAFINEGKAMGQLLRQARARGVEVEYISKLLDELEKETLGQMALEEISTPFIETGQASLVEPLTERELQVLRLLRSELTVPEIADELYVAVSTIRSHTKSIYSKLEVHGRSEAVARAEELRLI